MESEKKAFFSLSTCTFKISVSAYYNTPQSKNIEKKIHDKLLDLIIRISISALRRENFQSIVSNCVL